MSDESKTVLPEQLQLPPPQHYLMAATLANGWSDQYGGLHVAAGYSGVSLGTRYAVRGIWQHGCHGPWTDFSPDLLCNNTPNARALPVFVARSDQEKLLQAGGYLRARAIGLPIVYAQTPAVRRVPRSLLVVPTHTLAGAKFDDRAAFDRYAAEIAQVAPDFQRVVVCVHPSCRQNGFWVNEFASRGFEVIDGARSNDLNALPRMRMLFEQFESVTTNGWGSHVAYALAFGARVSICGTQPVRSEADVLRDTTWAADRQALKTALSAEIHERKQAFLKKFLVTPGAGVADVGLGRWLIGADLMLPPAELRDALLQLVEPQSSSVAGRQRAEPARDEDLSRARLLVRTGKKREAVQAFLGVASSAIATKDPHTIHAGLSQVAEEIAALEPALAVKLRGEAAKIAAAHGLQSAWRVAV